MKKIFIFLIITLFVNSFLLAEEAQHSYQVTVNGMVCSFCATNLEKSFDKNADVGNLKIDINSKLVTFTSSKEMDDASIKDIITNAGYAVDKIERK